MMQDVCKSCEEAMWNTVAGDAITNYICPVCDCIRQSGSTHTPKFCCWKCSREFKKCMECGTKLNTSNNQ